jgi:hypothetical protein
LTTALQRHGDAIAVACYGAAALGTVVAVYLVVNGL